MDLSKFNTAELRALGNQIEQLIADRNKAEIAQARENIVAIAKSVGIPLNELLGGLNGKATMPKSKSPLAPVYRNPDNAAQQWSGRGRHPSWVVAHLAAGKDLKSLLIAEQAG